jgi:hypothetical protein
MPQVKIKYLKHWHFDVDIPILYITVTDNYKG